MKYLFIISTAFLFLLSSCKKENAQLEKPAITKIKIGEVVNSQNLKATMWSDDSIATGYHKLYLSVTDASGNDVNNATVNVLPLMKMSMMTHSSPFEKPVYNPASKLYEFAVVFTMPSGSDSWSVKATINGEDQTFNINVPAAKTKLVGSYVGTDGSKYVVSLVPLKKWEVGLNDIKILVNKMADMMTFPSMDGLNIQMTPEMPSMGHGSPNNVDPTSIDGGYYKGRINYTMTGDWRIHFKIRKGDVVIIDDASIDILF
ncbi:MAG: hypothetical protein ABI288_07875 [Ginsengibacter sp.]